MLGIHTMYKCEYTGHSGDHTLDAIHMPHVLLVLNYIGFLTIVNNSYFLLLIFKIRKIYYIW